MCCSYQLDKLDFNFHIKDKINDIHLIKSGTYASKLSTFHRLFYNFQGIFFHKLCKHPCIPHHWLSILRKTIKVYNFQTCFPCVHFEQNLRGLLEQKSFILLPSKKETLYFCNFLEKLGKENLRFTIANDSALSHLFEARFALCDTRISTHR